MQWRKLFFKHFVKINCQSDDQVLVNLLFIFIVSLSLAYGGNECSIGEHSVVNDYNDVRKILKIFSSDEFSDQFCQGMSVCYREGPKKTCDFFEGFYKNALVSLKETGFGTCGMSKEELTLLKYYSTAGFTCLNSHLRGLETNAELSYLVEVMKNAIKKFPSYKGFVRRGVILPDSERSNYFEGNIVSDKAFLSSSTYQGFAFKKDQMIIFSRTGRMIMTVNNSSENEVLFEPNTKFKVLKSKSVEGRNFYVMREVVEGEDNEVSDEKILESIANMSWKQDYSSTDKWTCPKDNMALIPKEFKQKTTPDLVGLEKGSY